MVESLNQASIGWMSSGPSATAEWLKKGVMTVGLVGVGFSEQVEES